MTNYENKMFSEFDYLSRDILDDNAALDVIDTTNEITLGVADVILDMFGI